MRSHRFGTSRRYPRHATATTIVCAAVLAMVLPFSSVNAQTPGLQGATRYLGMLRVALGKAREIRTSHDIVRVAVGSEEIADIMLPPAKDPRLLRVVGKKTGTTNLIIWFADGSGPNTGRGVEYDVTVDNGYLVEVITGTVTDDQSSLKGW